MIVKDGCCLVEKNNLKSKNVKKNRRKRKFSVTEKLPILLLLFFIAVCAAAVHSQKNDIRELEDAKAHLVSEIEKEDKKIEELKKELEYQDSDAYITEIAQKELNMLKPNEMKIIVEND